jgi:hypothetical protein
MILDPFVHFALALLYGLPVSWLLLWLIGYLPVPALRVPEIRIFAAHGLTFLIVAAYRGDFDSLQALGADAAAQLCWLLVDWWRMTRLARKGERRVDLSRGLRGRFPHAWVLLLLLVISFATTVGGDGIRNEAADRFWPNEVAPWERNHVTGIYYPNWPDTEEPEGDIGFADIAACRAWGTATAAQVMGVTGVPGTFFCLAGGYYYGADLDLTSPFIIPYRLVVRG